MAINWDKVKQEAEQNCPPETRQARYRASYEGLVTMSASEAAARDRNQQGVSPALVSRVLRDCETDAVFARLVKILVGV